MDLLAIIKSRINAKHPPTVVYANQGTASMHADTNDELNNGIKNITTGNASDHDTYDTFSLTPSPITRNSHASVHVNNCVRSENNHSSNNCLGGTSEIDVIDIQHSRLPRLSDTPRKFQRRTKLRAKWSPEIQHLVDWFLTSDLPTEQFWLEDGPYLRSIENPARLYKSIQRDIETGSGGSKMMRDNLVANLKALHNKFNGKIKDLNNGSN